MEKSPAQKAEQGKTGVVPSDAGLSATIQTQQRSTTAVVEGGEETAGEVNRSSQQREISASSFLEKKCKSPPISFHFSDVKAAVSLSRNFSRFPSCCCPALSSPLAPVRSIIRTKRTATTSSLLPLPLHPSIMSSALDESKEQITIHNSLSSPSHSAPHQSNSSNPASSSAAASLPSDVQLRPSYANLFKPRAVESSNPRLRGGVPGQQAVRPQ